MLDHYEVKLQVYGGFRSELKPQITKDIKFLEEYSEHGRKPMRTLLSVTVEAESEMVAHDKAKSIINQFLGFYSLTTLNHFLIIPNIPAKVTKLTGDRKNVKVDTSSEFIDSEFDPNFFIKSMLPYFPIISKRGNEYLKIAIEYLRRTWHETEEREDIVILDCFVALEALFSKSGEKTEMTYKLSNRISTMLGDNTDSRIKIRKEIRDLYDLRSRIVHGDHIELQQNAFGNLIVYTREAIFRFVRLSMNYSSHNEIIDKIDDAMIDNSLCSKLRTESSDLYESLLREFGKSRKKLAKKYAKPINSSK